MSKRRSRVLRTLLSLALGTLFLFAISGSAFAQDETEPSTPIVEEVTAFATLDDVAAVQSNLDMTWVLLAGFLVFFMQAGFAMLEGGFIRQTGVVNSMAENFMDACVTGLVFFLVGYGIAFASTETSTIFGSPTLALGGIDGTGEGDGAAFVSFFFQFAFAGAAATIATGAMAERTDFRGKLIYSAIVALIIYPVVVFWTWGTGWLFEAGFLDFAGSAIVHMTGGIIALMGAIVVGARKDRVFGKPPRPSNLMLATLGTFVLWFGWYGFNVGSTLAASNVNQMGLVAVTTTLSACAGAMSAMTYAYLMKGGKWDLSLILNGSLAGLVGITAGCAFVTPTSSIMIGLVAGVLIVIATDVIESLKIDDAVGAFAVHGANGAWGTLAVGLFASEGLAGSAGLLMGGGFDLLGAQLLGIGAIASWATVTSFVMFKAIDAIGVLRISDEAMEMGIDVYEHGATVWPDVLPMPSEEPKSVGMASVPVAGD